MDTSRDKSMDGAPHIWLRYTTQFTTGGRTHTIEMGVPVPVGASAEEREQLIREAEAGMEQLTRRVEGRVSQILQRNQRAPEAGRPQGTPQQVASQAPAAPAPAREAPQVLSLPEKQAAVPPTRPSIAAEMPSMPGDAGGNMKLSQFIQVIREHWGLTPKQAMDLLNVKNLNGLNYREALKQLEPLVARTADNSPGNSPSAPGASNKNTPGGNQPKANEKMVNQAPAGAIRSLHAPERAALAGRAALERGLPEPPNRAPTTSSEELAGPPNIPVIPLIKAKDGMVREPAGVYKFDEEEEEVGIEAEEEDGQDGVPGVLARIKLDSLREIRGTSAASQARLTVLRNLLDSQINEEQLERLIQAAWGATSVKKLKVDQVEALISWAKEDYFVDEVEAVLDLIDKEESYARSDR